MQDISSHQELRKKLMQQIQNAFSDVIYEHITLFENPAWQLQGKHWREVPLDMLKRDGFIYSLPVSDTGRVFLPAYMVALLEHPEDLEGYDERLLDIFAPKSSSGSDKEVPFEYLNRMQRIAILVFLESYPSLFPHLFELKTFPPEVQEFIRKTMPPTNAESFTLLTPYELWGKATTFWKHWIASS